MNIGFQGGTALGYGMSMRERMAKQEKDAERAASLSRGAAEELEELRRVSALLDAEYGMEVVNDRERD